VTHKELLLPHQKRYRSVLLHQELSDEEIAMDWTLSESDQQEMGHYRKNYRLFLAIQLCAVTFFESVQNFRQNRVKNIL
jgi:hypothetical protein